MKRVATIAALLFCVSGLQLSAETNMKEVYLLDSSATTTVPKTKEEGKVKVVEQPVPADPSKVMVGKLEAAKAYGRVLAAKKPNFDGEAFENAIDEMISAVSAL